MLLRSAYYIADPSKQEAAFEFFREEINYLVASRAFSKAKASANNWASWLCDDFGLPVTTNWKTFKRSLAAKWFGAPERRVFKPSWQATDVIQYGLSLLPRIVRVSSFPDGIACHAKSERLLAANRREWAKTISLLDPNSVVEVFPESSSSTSICFRRCSGAFGEEARYEASSGQAMAAFESEQGEHPIVTAFLHDDDGLRPSLKMPTRFPLADVTVIKRRLLKLLESREAIIASKCRGLCRKSGLPWLGIEGYFDSEQNERVTVVDIDLPFDFVFMLQ